MVLAQRERPLLCISGDGSAMYSIQALWTAARRSLPIVFVIPANREYGVLEHNIVAYRQRFEVKSEKPYMHMDLTRSALAIVDCARERPCRNLVLYCAGRTPVPRSASPQTSR